MSQNIELKNFELVTVNPNNKTWETSDLFCFWANTIQTILGFSLIASLYLIYDLNSGIVLLGSLIASLMIYILVNLIGLPSQKHGIPFPIILKSPFISAFTSFVKAATEAVIVLAEGFS